MADDIYEDEFTAARKRRQHEVGVVDHAEEIAATTARILDRGPAETALGEALAAEVEVSAARLSRMAELERRLGVAQDALRKACDWIERTAHGHEHIEAPDAFDGWRKIAEERR